MRIAATVSFVAVLLGGCSPNITLQRLDRAGTNPKGVPWNLAMTQYTLTITRQVTGCTGNLNGNVTISATVGKARDPIQQYVLSSDGFWSTADLTSTLAADGTSTGLNAHSEDATGTVISNLVSLAATAASGIKGEKIATDNISCEPAVYDALRPDIGLKFQQSVVDKDNAEINAATEKVTELTTLLQAGSTDKKTLAAAVSDLTVKQSKLSADQTILSKTTKLLTDTQTVVWPLDSAAVSTKEPFQLPTSALTKWVNWRGKDGDKPAPPPADLNIAGFNVWLALYLPDGAGGWKQPSAESSAIDSKSGVPVRVARVGRLIACTGKAACDEALNASWVPDPTHSVVVHPDQPVLQLGQWYVLPIAGGRFKSEGVAVSMDSTGNPTSMEIYEKTAVVAAAATAASQAATQIAAIPVQIAAAKLARTQADTNQINAENALATAKANQLVAVPTATALAQAGLATAQANLATAKANANAAGPTGAMALITAQNNLAVAEANAGILPQVNALTAQSTLINAQANEINAQVSLAKAKAALQALP